MIPEKHGIITPAPFYKISFGCSNRKFYEVKSELYAVANKIDIEIQDGYIEEKCDYEGDLERIIIYNGERGKKLINEVLEHYNVKYEIPLNMNLVLSIF